MDKYRKTIIRKAGRLTCLFLFLNAIGLMAQSSTSVSLIDRYERAHKECLSLNLKEARTILYDDSSPEALRILSMADMLELLITEDIRLFDEYETTYEQRLDRLKKEAGSEIALYALAEIRLQWAFVYLKFGHDLTSAWSVRQAHTTIQECRKHYPSFQPALKTEGILQVMFGSVPDKYQWILSLLGMKGSVEQGLTQLAQVSTEEEPAGFEAQLVSLLINGFILQQTDSALAGIENLHHQLPANRLVLYLGATLALKNSMSEVAMNMLLKFKQLPDDGLSVIYTDYLLGEVYLHQGNYRQSIQSFQSFIREYKGKNFVKDAHYKIGICYWLNGMIDEAERYYNLARISGKASAEADTYAARAVANNVFPHVKLAKVRYSTDGGYYRDALRTLQSINKSELVQAKDLAEYQYRYARLYHKTGKIEQAMEAYLQTITLCGDQPWYFAPNACLQLGYLYRDLGNRVQAESFFRKAMTYKKHEYKNSIDSKARSALNQLK